MVIPDWSVTKRPFTGPPAAREERAVELARPLDRLAAAIVDTFVLLVPIFLLISAPVKRWMTASFILGVESDFALNLMVMVVMAVVLIVTYQTVCHRFFSATLGKKLFGLRLEPMFEGERLGTFDLALRALLWIFEMVLLGLPWLAVFANPKRRPMHDRFCDTVVVARAGAGVRQPEVWERGLVRTIYATCFALMLLVFVWEVRGVIEKMKLDSAFLALAEREAGGCEAISLNADKAHAEFKRNDEHGRLKTAMALYAAGLVERGCLESEIEREISLQVPIAGITYLAQAFINADDAEVSNAYLDRVCKDAPDSVECSMSQMVGSWSDENWAAVEAILKSAPRGSGYLEIWGVRHYMKQADYESALALLDSLIDRREIAEFSLVQRVKALFNGYREAEAESALAQAALSLPESDAQNLSSWMCVQQLQQGCEATKGLACQRVKSNEPIDFENTHAALAHVLADECGRQREVDYLSLSEAARSEAWQLFFRANLKRQREDRSAAASLYLKVVETPSTPDLLRIEATRRLMQFANTRQLDNLIELWSQFDSKEAWVKTGNLLFRQLADQKNPELALKVARRLMNARALSPHAVPMLSALVQEAAPGLAKRERRPASTSGKQSREQLRHWLDNMESEP